MFFGSAGCGTVSMCIMHHNASVFGQRPNGAKKVALNRRDNSGRVTVSEKQAMMPTKTLMFSH